MVGNEHYMMQDLDGMENISIDLTYSLKFVHKFVEDVPHLDFLHLKDQLFDYNSKSGLNLHIPRDSFCPKNCK